MGFKCMNRGCGAHIPTRIGITTVMHFKWKDKTRMTKIHVCKSCWDKARSLKVEK